MSDEIQAISQGNYILATQQEVSHDNSLSGNGTVDSPLGVVPGYNETVLYSGAYNASTKSITFSEPLTSFEKVSVLWNHMNTTTTVYGTYDANSNAWFQHGGRFIGTAVSQCYDFITQWNITPNRMSANFYTDMISIPPTGYAIKNGGYNELMPVKVIGINRKAQ